MQRSLFSELQVSPEIKSAVEKIGLERCSSLQTECIPLIKERKDVLAKCQSSAGVVETYGLSVIDLVDSEKSGIQFLIVVSNRARVLSVTRSLRTLNAGTPNISIANIYNGQSAELLERVVKAQPHILVATLSELTKHIEEETISFDDLNAIIIDELSEVVATTTDEIIETLLESTTEDTQFVAFTNSDSESVLGVTEQFTEEYVQVSIEPSVDLESSLKEEVFETGKLSKPEVLERLLETQLVSPSVVFVNSRQSLESISDFFAERGYKTAKLNGSTEDSVKNDTMDTFSAGDIDFLVTTDLGSVGLDMDGIKSVIQYELSDEIDDFADRVKIHEKNIILVAKDELGQIDAIESALKKSLRRFQVPFLDGAGSDEENKLVDLLKAKLARGDFRQRQDIVEKLLSISKGSHETISVLIEHALDLQSKARGNSEPRQSRRHSGQSGGQRDNNFKRSAAPKKQRPANSQAMTQISLNVGYRDQIKPNHVVGAILGETGLSADCVGMIEIFDNNVLVEVAKEHSDLVLDSLNQTNINGIKIKAEFGHSGGSKNSNDRDRGRGNRSGGGRRGGGGYRNKGNNQSSSYHKRSNGGGSYE